VRRRQITLAVALAGTALLVVLAFLLPVPYVVEEPGPVFDTLGTVGTSGPAVVQISHAKTYSSGGHIYLTTVEDIPGDCSSHPLLSTAVKAWFDHNDSVVPVQAVCAPGKPPSDVVAMDESDMAESQIDAETAALTTLGYRVVGHEVIVAAVQPGYPAARALRPEDVVRSIDGQRITRPQQAVDAVRSRPVGTPLDFVVTRGTATLHRTITSVAAPTSSGGTDPHTPFVGFTPSPRPLFDGIDVNIGINPLDVGGPSAGTALALGIIDKLTPGGLTGGKVIAGTGTITRTGRIGEIGGIQQKISAAAAAGASVFFSPAANCADAKAQAPASMTLIKATTLSGLVHSLKEIRAGRTDVPRC
jgi:PDZ domain-containing protein